MPILLKLIPGERQPKYLIWKDRNWKFFVCICKNVHIDYDEYLTRLRRIGILTPWRRHVLSFLLKAGRGIFAKPVGEMMCMPLVTLVVVYQLSVYTYFVLWMRLKSLDWAFLNYIYLTEVGFFITVYMAVKVLSFSLCVNCAHHVPLWLYELCDVQHWQCCTPSPFLGLVLGCTLV